MTIKTKYVWLWIFSWSVRIISSGKDFQISITRRTGKPGRIKRPQSAVLIFAVQPTILKSCNTTGRITAYFRKSFLLTNLQSSQTISHLCIASSDFTNKHNHKNLTITTIQSAIHGIPLAQACFRIEKSRIIVYMLQIYMYHFEILSQCIKNFKT